MVGYYVVFAMDEIDTLMESEEVTWRDILYNVLKGLDPWDVDVVELATRYSTKVDQMREMNFRVPANVVLVCAVLLRMKAEILTPKPEKYPNLAASMNFIFNNEYPIAAVLGAEVEPYPISIKPARVHTRRVSAQELIDAIQDTLRDKEKRIQRISARANAKAAEQENPTELVLEPEVNILELIEETYQRIAKILLEKEVALFSEMAKTKDDVLHMFLTILHLSNSERVKIRQEQLFGEIYIHPA